MGTLIEGSISAEGKNQVKVTTWLEDAAGNDLGKRANFVISFAVLLSGVLAGSGGWTWECVSLASVPEGTHGR